MKPLIKDLLLLPQKEVHEQDYGEEEHGQATASLSDDGEDSQVVTRNGFIKGSLQRDMKIKGVYAFIYRY